MVVLESLAHGVPVVCLNIGGPGTIVTDDCGRVVEVSGRSRAQVVDALARALAELTNEDKREQLAENGRRRCLRFSWRHMVARVYGEAV
jgi:glycosyltransferase involved in cell wall biosynthesis